ncbi:transporter [Actinoplanes sp. NBC_00393]|uniref:transporter n=1 Tax=Actinoplanes sp. NBC_00393 TaxID=2975953 RepID=UPI002E1FE838
MDEPSIEDPAEALRLIQREQANLERELTPDPRWMFWPWGVAWLVGSGLFFLRYGPGGRVLVDMPDWVPMVALIASIVIAGTITGVVGMRSGRQISGPGSRQGAMYGFAWSAGSTGLAIVIARVSDALPEHLVGLLWGGGMVTLVGTLYMAGGAIWNDRNMFVLGAWINGVNIVGVLIGPGWHALIVAVAGGGGLLVAGLVGWLRLR